ncbi:unnamed protein product [Gadus morhua 'NCC']
MGKKRQIKRQEGDQETLCGDSSSPPGEQRPAQVPTSSQKKERLRQVVIRWMETNEEANDPVQGQTPPDQGQTPPDHGQTPLDHGQTAPDQGQTAPDQGQTAPDQGQNAPDQGQTAPDQGQTSPDQGQTSPDQGQTPDEPEPQHQGEGSGPFVAWLPPTADGPPRKDLAQVVGNLKVRVKGVRKLSVETATMDPGQTAQDPKPAPQCACPPTKALAQVMGNLRFRVKGLKKKRVQPATTSRLDEEKPLGRPSGRSPFPGQTALDEGQTAPDQGQTAPDQGQTAPDQDQTGNEPEPQHQGEGSGPFVAWLPPTADRPPRKDLAQVVGNLKVRVKGVRKLSVETATMDPGQTAQDPNQLPNVPDSPPTKALAQVMGNLRFRVKGLKKKRVQPATTSRLDEEKPLGRPSGRSPFPGQTALDEGQTAPDQGQTAPDQARPPRTKARPPRTKARPPMNLQTGPRERTCPRSWGT